MFAVMLSAIDDNVAATHEMEGGDLIDFNEPPSREYNEVLPISKGNYRYFSVDSCVSS